MKMSYDIFISYRRDGGETMAILLRDRLTTKGYNVFLDVESLNAGSFNTQLLDVIEACRDIIVVLSENSLDRCKNEGDWVREELAHAFKHEKNIIPFMLRNFKFPDTLPEDIKSLPLQNGVNATSNEYFDASVERLTNKFLKSKPKIEMQNTIIIESEQPASGLTLTKKKKKILMDLIPLFILMLFVIGGIMYFNNKSFEKPIESEPDNTSEISSATAAMPNVSNEPEDLTVEILEADYSERAVNTTIAAGYYGVVAVKSDGTVVTHDIDDDLSGWRDIVSVSVGSEHALGLRSDGTVVVMGSSDDGRSDVSRWKDITTIEAGYYFSLGLKKNGTVEVAGYRFGYIAEVIMWRDIVAIASGMHHVVGLKADGTVVAVGGNSYGECMVSGWGDIVAVYANDFFTLGLKADGTVVFTGDNVWEYDWDEYSEGASFRRRTHWNDSIENWQNIKSVHIGDVGRGDIFGVKSDGTVIASNGENASGIEFIADWRDIIAVTSTFDGLFGLQNDGNVLAIDTSWGGEEDKERFTGIKV